MKLYAGFLVSLRELCSRMQVSVSICLHLHMTSHLCLLVLSGLALSSHLDLEDVFFSPQNQTVREGEAVFFQCVSGESSPPSNITWLRDGEVVTRGRQIQGEYGGGQQKKTSGTLHLFNVTLEDDGMYVCVTHNPSLNISKESRAAKLTVRGVPRRLQIIQGPDNITVAMGTEVSMHCAVRGFPVPMVHWFKDGCLLTNCSSSFSLQNNGQLLTFRNVTKEDEGSYHCEASNQKETVKSQPAFLLPAEMDWSFVQQPTNLTVRTGENVTMSCRPPHSRPAPEVSWFRNNRLLSPTAHVTVLPSGDLFFHRIQEFDSGSYFCRASNIHLQRFLTSRRATLTVLAPPSVKLWPQVLTVPVGARVVLECQVSGHPLPSISWMKRGPSKQTGGKIALGLRNASLYIQSARSYDEGVYVCEASNAVGQSQSTALLRVAASPVIVTFAGHVSCRTGASVVLPCRAVGIEPITYTWTRGGAETRVPIGPTQHRHTDDGALHIPSVQSSDAGEYFCTAENRVGRHQRRTTLTITAEEHPDDRGKQTRQILSASTNPGGKLPDSKSNVFMAEQQLRTTHHPHVEEQREETTCSSSNSGTTFPPFSRKSVAALKLQLRLNQPTSSPTRPLVTQMQPLILPPPPHPNFQSLHTQLPMTSHPPFTREVLGATLRYLPSGSQPRLSPTSSQTQVSNELFVQPDSRDVHTASQPPSRRPVGEPFDLLKFDSHVPTPTQNPVSQTETSYSHLITSTAASEAETHTFQTGTRQPVTKGSLSQSDHEASTLLQLTQTKRIHLQQTSHPQRSFNLSFLPKFYLELPTIHPFTQPTELLFSTIRPSRSTLEAEGVHHVNRSDQLNATTSNDLRVTQRSPSWLPVLEKHDIPVVVGVGVSLAFIFITVTFYSVVQKNEPTSRAAQRNLGVPVRHNERRAAGRTYENKAFEDDDCMAVIEQSPNTSDTRARPSGPSLVTVQMEPTFEELQEDTQQAVDDHSVTVEMYPEAIVDTKIDPSLEEEEKVCSLSQPSIQLQCAEDWTSNRGDNHSPCQDALPPPSSVPSCSPSPSPPSRREEGLRSSLTLQSGEPCSAPIHHSLSISHGNPPLLLSHHVSLGLTTVAVDVHFYPASTASMAVGTSTHISSASNSTSVTAPLFSPPLVNNQENEQTTGRFHQFK